MQPTAKRRGLSKGEVGKKLEELADLHVQGLKGKERTRTRRILLAMLHKAAWYGALCAARSAEMSADRLFDSDWLSEKRE